MKFKLANSLVSKILIAVFLMVISFIFGASMTKTVNFDPIEQSKINISNVLAYSDPTEFRNITYYFNRKTQNEGKLGYVCGEVYTLDNNKLPEGFKRFIVKVYEPPKGLTLLSFPIIEGGEDALLSDKIDDIWLMFCHV